MRLHARKKHISKKGAGVRRRLPTIDGQSGRDIDADECIVLLRVDCFVARSALFTIPMVSLFHVRAR